MESWYGVDDLIQQGAEENFGPATEKFLKEAEEKQKYLKKEILRRYEVWEGYNMWST